MGLLLWLFCHWRHREKMKSEHPRAGSFQAQPEAAAAAASQAAARGPLCRLRGELALPCSQRPKTQGVPGVKCDPAEASSTKADVLLQCRPEALLSAGNCSDPQGEGPPPGSPGGRCSASGCVTDPSNPPHRGTMMLLIPSLRWGF